MIECKYLLWISVVCLIISLTVSYIEIRKYYKHEAELARTNDMYISHTHCLSTLGILNVIISIVIISGLITAGLYHFNLV